jgi:hypothetical protein
MLTDVEKVTRFQRAQELLAALQSVEYRVWQYVVTLDESWFYCDIDWETQWLPADDEPGTRRSRGIGREKTILAVVWNTRGLYLIDVIPRGEKFRAQYFLDKTLTPICTQLIRIGRRKLGIQADDS